jgi:hypothetical protein
VNHLLNARIVNERGAAVVIALVITMLLAVLGAGMLTLTTTETMIAASYRHAQEASYGAEAALERAMTDLATIADWSVVVATPNVMSSLNDGVSSVRLPDGLTVSVAALSADRQRESDISGPAMYRADNPQWRLFAHAPIEDLLSSPATAPPLYLLVWVADDGNDGDGDPTRDSNGRVIVHAEAHGSGGARRGVEAVITRSGNGVLRVHGWQRRP